MHGIHKEIDSISHTDSEETWVAGEESGREFLLYTLKKIFFNVLNNINVLPFQKKFLSKYS